MRIRVSIVLLALFILVACAKTKTSPTVSIPAQYQTFLSGVKLSDPQDPVAIIDTSKGMIAFEVYEAKTPQTAANFLKLVQQGFYDGLQFHRVEPGFVI